jgi:hypothetical protein
MTPLRAAAVLSVVLLLLVSVASAQEAERPTYALGDRWIRSDGVYELVRIERDRYVFAARPGDEIHLSKSLGLLRLERNGAVFEFAPPPEPVWPLRVGRIGSVVGTWRTPRDANLSKKFTWSVDRYEDVKVAGTTLKAFLVTVQITDPVPGIGSRRWEREIRLWYAPEARHYVKVESDALGPMLNFAVVSLDRPSPLAIKVEQPASETRFPTEDATITGRALSGSGVDRVTVSVNGVEIARRDYRQRPKEALFRLPVRLGPGRNVVLVTASAGGDTTQQALTLFHDRPAPVTAPAPPAPPPANAPSARPAPPPAATPALEVKVASPADQARVQQDSVVLAGIVAGGKGVSRVVVTVNGAEVSTVDERAPRPAVALNVAVKLREGANTLVVTATDAEGRAQQEVRTVHYEPVVPLGVAVRYPEDRARLADASSVVVATVASSKGVARVSVTLNGAEVAVPAPPEVPARGLPRSLSLTVPLTLREGTNVIVITAAEADGTLRQELRTVTYQPPQIAAPASPQAPAAPPRPEPDRWAVVIGIGSHDSADIPRLRFAVPDAEAVYQALVGMAGFKKEHVLLLTDKTERKPTLKNIKWALGTFLSRSAKKDDTVMIFFAGHGAPEVDQRGLERDGLAKYLVPSDADPDDLYSSALPMDELQTIFGRIEAERVVALLDACYSGAAGGRTFASKKTRAGHVDDVFLERLTRAKGRAILTAARPAEVSVELPELGHGIFTYYVVQGLKGAGDLNRDGIVSLQELYEYVEQQVARKSRAAGGNQHPVMKGELEGALPLVRLGPPAGKK